MPTGHGVRRTRALAPPLADRSSPLKLPLPTGFSTRSLAQRGPAAGREGQPASPNCLSENWDCQRTSVSKDPALVAVPIFLDGGRDVDVIRIGLFLPQFTGRAVAGAIVKPGSLVVERLVGSRSQSDGSERGSDCSARAAEQRDREETANCGKVTELRDCLSGWRRQKMLAGSRIIRHQRI